MNRTIKNQEKLDIITRNIQLYHMYSCPYCVRVRRANIKLNLDIEEIDISSNREARDELLMFGGKIQVPCIKISHEDRTEWLYESAKIIQHLEEITKNTDG